MIENFKQLSENKMLRANVLKLKFEYVFSFQKKTEKLQDFRKICYVEKQKFPQKLKCVHNDFDNTAKKQIEVAKSLIKEFF
jgi:hypothetical protein